MRRRWDLVHCALSLAAFSLTAEVCAAPLDNDGCNASLNVDFTDCCSRKNNETVLMEPLIPERCSSILLTPDSSSPEVIEVKMECFFECLFATADLLNEENEVDPENLLMNLTNDLEPISRKLSINSIKNCIEKDYVVEETAICKSGSLQFFLCVHRANTLLCPREDWKNSEECNSYRQLLENCPKRKPFLGPELEN